MTEERVPRGHGFNINCTYRADERAGKRQTSEEKKAVNEERNQTQSNATDTRH